MSEPLYKTFLPPKAYEQGLALCKTDAERESFAKFYSVTPKLPMSEKDRRNAYTYIWNPR